MCSIIVFVFVWIKEREREREQNKILKTERKVKKKDFVQDMMDAWTYPAFELVRRELIRLGLYVYCKWKYVTHPEWPISIRHKNFQWSFNAVSQKSADIHKQ